jgi:hypothetical protein
MQIVDVLLNAVLAVLRFVLRLLGLMVALALVLVILFFVFIWALLRLLSGRRPTVNVSAHFSRVRSFTDLGQGMSRRRTWADEGVGGPAPLLRRQPGDVQDVQARELPPERDPNSR